jgi:hypothetical protein
MQTKGSKKDDSSSQSLLSLLFVYIRTVLQHATDRKLMDQSLDEFLEEEAFVLEGSRAFMFFTHMQFSRSFVFHASNLQCLGPSFL